jgi:hypothetical protein
MSCFINSAESPALLHEGTATVAPRRSSWVGVMLGQPISSSLCMQRRVSA